MDDSRPLMVELTYEGCKVEQYTYLQKVDNSVGIVAGEWVSLPKDLKDEECEWVFYELGPKMRHLGKE